jgi:hypothetical protein
MRHGGVESVISILASHYCVEGWTVEIALKTKYREWLWTDSKQ